MHRHKWTPTGGCTQNPGVMSRPGDCYLYTSACSCGARRYILERPRSQSGGYRGHVEAHRAIVRPGEPRPTWAQ